MARDDNQLADNSWFGLLVPTGDVLGNAQSLFENGYRAVSEESLRFVNRRHEHNSRTIAQYRDSKDPESFLLAQQDWATGMLRDYSEGAARMMEAMYKCFSSAAGKSAGKKDIPTASGAEQDHPGAA